MRMVNVLVAALFLLGSLAHAADESTLVKGVAIFAKDVPTCKDGVLEIRLYEYDPRLADKGADLVELFELKSFNHIQGSETKKEFIVGAKGKIKPNRSYYLTCFVLHNNVRTFMGKCEHGKDTGLDKVLVGGAPNTVTVHFKSLKK